jgi:hypothetical protein
MYDACFCSLYSSSSETKETRCVDDVGHLVAKNHILDKLRPREGLVIFFILSASDTKIWMINKMRDGMCVITRTIVDYK